MASEISQPRPEPRAQELFPNTLWSAVVGATDPNQARAEESLARLCELYRVPILNWFRRAGLSPAEAEDQTHNFLARHFSGGRFRHFERRQARFRSWLLVCLRRQLVDRARAAGPLLEPLEHAEDSMPPEAEADDLDRDVARTVHQRALFLAQAAWSPDRLELFRILTSFLFADPQSGAYAHTAEQYQLPARQVKAEMFKLRHDYSVAFHGEVRQICLPGDDEAEMKHLLALVPRL